MKDYDRTENKMSYPPFRCSIYKGSEISEMASSLSKALFRLFGQS